MVGTMKPICTLSLLLLLLFPSCRGYYYTPPGLEETLEQSPSLKEMKRQETVIRPGPITFRVEINEYETEDTTIHLDTVLILLVDAETDLIQLNGELAFKLFHVEATEYGHTRHMYLIHFFYLFRGEWRLVNGSSYYTNVPIYDGNSHSLSYPIMTYSGYMYTRYDVRLLIP